MSLLNLTLPSPVTISSPRLHPRRNLRTLRFSQPSKFSPPPQFKPLNSTKLNFNPPDWIPRIQNENLLTKTAQLILKFKTFLLPQHRPILLGWLCSCVSVFSLSQIVQRIGSLTSKLNNNVCVAYLRNQGLLICGLVLARLVAGYWQQAFLWDAALSAVYQVRIFVFEKVLERELAFFEGGSGISSGDIAYRISAEASDVADTVYAILNTIVPSALQLSAMAMQMVAISPTLSFISALVIPCMALVITYLGERLRKISKKARLSIASLAAYLNEVFPAILFVKASNAESSEYARFQELARADLSAHLGKKKMKALIPQLVQMIYFGALFALCTGSIIFSRGSFDGCRLVSFVTSLVFLIEPIQDVGKAYNELKLGETAIERLFDLTELKQKVTEKPDALNVGHVKGDVKFRDVSFKYGDNMPPILNGFNLHIKAGETVALVGPSGGGKTTLVKLLLRLYDPSSGSILVDDHNIQNIRLESLRRHIGLVSQDITLFSGTIAENIGYRDLMTKIDMERVKTAAQIANADEFIKTLPGGYRCNIGPRGSLLSGGQKQRLAIARALYQNSSILILDEATSALDGRSELLVRQAVERLMENHTVLVIAHRLETVLMANRIFLLDDGKLEELPRSTLLAKGRDSLSGFVI